MGSVGLEEHPVRTYPQAGSISFPAIHRGLLSPTVPVLGNTFRTRAQATRGRSTPHPRTALVHSWSPLDAGVKVRPARESCISSREFPLHRSQRIRDGPGGDSRAAGAPRPLRQLLPPQCHTRPSSYFLNSPSSHFHQGPGHRQVSYSRHHHCNSEVPVSLWS